MRTFTSAGHGFQPGDTVTMTTTVPDPRWWRRLGHWLLRRDPPTTVEMKTFTIGECSTHTFAAEPQKDAAQAAQE